MPSNPVLSQEKLSNILAIRQQLHSRVANMTIVISKRQGASQAVGPGHLVVGYSPQEIKLFMYFKNCSLNAVKQYENSWAGLRKGSWVGQGKIEEILSMIAVSKY